MKAKFYEVSISKLATLFVTGVTFTITNGIPETAQVRRASLDIKRDVLIIVTEDESFDDVPEGDCIKPEYLTVTTKR